MGVDKVDEVDNHPLEKIKIASFLEWMIINLINLINLMRQLLFRAPKTFILQQKIPNFSGLKNSGSNPLQTLDYQH